MTKLLSPFTHRGTLFYEGTDDRIFDAEHHLLGWISSRGVQYTWTAVDGQGLPFAVGVGNWDEDWNGHDPAMDHLLQASAR